MDTVLHHVRFALRTLPRDHSFVLTALLTMGVVIGASAAIFSIAAGRGDATWRGRGWAALA